jgi:hypothetical protein
MTRTVLTYGCTGSSTNAKSKQVKKSGHGQKRKEGIVKGKSGNQAKDSNNGSRSGYHQD